MQLFDVYPLLDLKPVNAEGAYIYTEDGNKYLDFYGGHGVISVGHSHPRYVQYISQQLQKLGFYSNSVQNPLQHQLAQKLGQLSGYEEYQLFLCNSGAEANENALKAASFYNNRSKIISFKRSFHGRTSAAVGITDNDQYAAPVNKSSETVFLELNDQEALESELSRGDVCAVVLEGIQGIGGIHIPDKAFLQKTRELCNQTGTVLILDEIQSGYGRSGRFFAHQHADIQADIVTVAKGMGNGFPVAGTIIHPDIKPFHGELGSTFGGNHLACAAALSVLDILDKEHLIQHAATIGSYLIKELSSLPTVKEVRGMGLMIGIEFPFPIQSLRSILIEDHRILTGISSNPNVLRLLPPLIITKEQANHIIEIFDTILTQHSF